ncbi:hypothetical protein BH23ACT5_BH23ACT5_24590 [soil metagenome]
MTDPRNDLRRYGHDLAEAVSVERSDASVNRALTATHRQAPRRRLTVVLASVGLLVIGNTALATVAERSVPGDLLYPVERTYEWVAVQIGVGGDIMAKRLDEAGILVERGEPLLALDLIVEALGDGSVTAAATELSEADLDHNSLLEHVGYLVASAHQVAAAARSGDEATRTAAIAAIRQHAADTAQAARDRGHSPATPDAPGRDDSSHGPPAENPGQGQGPPAENPGQGQDQGSGRGQVSRPGSGRDSGYWFPTPVGVACWSA